MRALVTRREKSGPSRARGDAWIAHRPRVCALSLHGCPRAVALDALPAAGEPPTATAATAHVSDCPFDCRHRPQVHAGTCCAVAMCSGAGLQGLNCLNRAAGWSGAARPQRGFRAGCRTVSHWRCVTRLPLPLFSMAVATPGTAIKSLDMPGCPTHAAAGGPLPSRNTNALTTCSSGRQSPQSSSMSRMAGSSSM